MLFPVFLCPTWSPSIHPSIYFLSPLIPHLGLQGWNGLPNTLLMIFIYIFLNALRHFKCECTRPAKGCDFMQGCVNKQPPGWRRWASDLDGIPCQSAFATVHFANWVVWPNSTVGGATHWAKQWHCNNQLVCVLVFLYKGRQNVLNEIWCLIFLTLNSSL